MAAQPACVMRTGALLTIFKTSIIHKFLLQRIKTHAAIGRGGADTPFIFTICSLTAYDKVLLLYLSSAAC